METAVREVEDTQTIVILPIHTHRYKYSMLVSLYVIFGERFMWAYFGPLFVIGSPSQDREGDNLESI